MSWVILLIKAAVVFNLVVSLASLCTWIERKASALLQNRIGANRALAFTAAPVKPLGPMFFVLRWLGILGVVNTLVCDPVKALFKEDFVPEETPLWLHALAPFWALVPVFAAFAVIPIAPEFTLGGRLIRPQVAVLDAGLLFLAAMGGLAVYGPTLAGWCAYNKFALLGGLRAAAQMISYELAMGITFAAVAAAYGTLDLYQMAESQNRWWGLFTQPLSALILFVVGMAETKRSPFDLPEAESEIVAGYFTEYSGMKFLLFWMGEFAEIALFSAVFSLLFLGGWRLPLVDLPPTWWAALLGHAVFMAKVVGLCVLQIVLRWTLPRFRYDQLMALGWKILLPLSLFNLAVTAVLKAGV